MLPLAACEQEPTAPGVHTVRGHVKLTGYLVNATQGFAGTRVVGDADGVLVELVFGDQVVARTTTVDGVYVFPGIGPGGYVIRTAVGPLYDETLPLTVARSDLAVADTLRLAPQGGHLFPVPNPVWPFTLIYFHLNDSTQVDLRIVDLAGREVRHIAEGYEFQPGLQYVGWDCYDEDGRPATDAMYWLLFQAGSDRRTQLLFR